MELSKYKLGRRPIAVPHAFSRQNIKKRIDKTTKHIRSSRSGRLAGLIVCIKD